MILWAGNMWLPTQKVDYKFCCAGTPIRAPARVCEDQKIILAKPKAQRVYGAISES
jgi:hypothetical protein